MYGHALTEKPLLLSSQNSGAPTVVLTRLVQGPIDASQLPNGLAVSTVSGRNALDNLEKSLRSVYRPLLNDDSSVRLLDQISAVIAQTRSSSTSSLDPNALPIHGIASVEDELSRWTALSERDVGDAAEVAAALAPLRTAVQRTSGPEAPTGEDILDVVDAADKVLQDVSEMQCSGRPAYDAAHLEHAMFLVASHVQACAQRAASSVDVFQGPFDQVHPVLQLCYSAFTHLEASFGGLSAFFASSVDHWPERSSKLAFVHRLKERAHSLLQLR